MSTEEPERRADAAWLQPRANENELRRYLTTIRQRAWLIVVAVIVCTAGALVYVKTATPVYEASAQLLVTPISSSDASTLGGLGLIVSSSDPTQDVETAARLAVSIDAAARAKIQLGLKESPQAILNRISVQPVSQSNVLVLTAQASTATGAAVLANTLATDALASRAAQFRAEVDRKITTLNTQIATTTQPAAKTALAQQVATLQGLRASGLPDMSLSTRAVPPTGRTSPKATLSVAGAIIAGLVLGLVGAFAVEAFDTTLRREEQLRRLFQLPVLARISRERDRSEHLSRRIPGLGAVMGFAFGKRPPPRLPETLSPSSKEAFRTLRATLLASRTSTNPVRSMLVTSASPSEGKTTTAINLAVSLALSGVTTILIEADMRRPTVGRTVGLRARYGLADVLTGEVDLAKALCSSDRYPKNLSFLLASRDSGQQAISGDALFLPTVGELLGRAEELAECVVIDAPPLAAVIDALNLTREVDSVLLVTMLGRTRVDRLTELGALLARTGVTPAGLVVIGTPVPGGLGRDGYGYASTETPPPEDSRPSHPSVRKNGLGSGSRIRS